MKDTSLPELSETDIDEIENFFKKRLEYLQNMTNEMLKSKGCDKKLFQMLIHSRYGK